LSRIELITRIAAPPQRCFDLARCVDLHLRSAAPTGEQAVAGKTTGLLSLGDEVTWRGRHFGVVQELASRITLFEPPQHFRDSMVRGAFRRLDHDHFFVADGSATEMRDVFDFDAPLGVLGRIADALVLRRYMHNFLVARNAALRAIAESDEWRRYLPAA
jgi:ligand-binding SRPBCC domain-containing protein